MTTLTASPAQLAARILRHQFAIALGAVVLFETAVAFFFGGSFVEWFRYWWMFPIAFAVALAVNTAGISSAALFVPFFILLFPALAGHSLELIDTVRLGLITESFGLSSSALAFLAFGLVDMRLAGRSIIAAFPFVLSGVALVFFIPGSILYLMIATLLIASVLLLRFERVLSHKRKHAHVPAGFSVAVADAGASVEHRDKSGTMYRYAYTKTGALQRFFGYSVGGVFQGAAGFGTGEIGIITMLLSHIPVRIAIGTSHIIVASTAIVAALAHFALVSGNAAEAFPWAIPLMTVPAAVLGGQLAPHLAAKLPTAYLERFVSVLFVAIAGALIMLAITTA